MLDAYIIDDIKRREEERRRRDEAARPRLRIPIEERPADRGDGRDEDRPDDDDETNEDGVVRISLEPRR